MEVKSSYSLQEGVKEEALNPEGMGTRKRKLPPWKRKGQPREKAAKHKGRPDTKYISLQRQVKVLRAFLLATIIMLTLYSVRFQHLYSEILEYYQLSVELDAQIYDQYQMMHENYQEIFRMNQEMFRATQETSDLLQKVLDAFNLCIISEEVPVSP